MPGPHLSHPVKGDAASTQNAFCRVFQLANLRLQAETPWILS